ncbi:hypothetical protein [Gordonia neofelifaecis]|uniref:Uncharacterized protein n=1 Tax=Gordonia neofelifaecis NRRL B-59395 TaxID=644548 RepID=F1YLB4_9ACTN|nr:hypothetical protein [Gordonia neofelifaecis]EGD54574.1 hypothetical protein SCNU_13368 [Gordonia neofelifaecis NRRL B-59395]
MPVGGWTGKVGAAAFGLPGWAGPGRLGGGGPAGARCCFGATDPGAGAVPGLVGAPAAGVPGFGRGGMGGGGPGGAGRGGGAVLGAEGAFSHGAG